MRGIWLMILASACFTMMTGLVKIANTQLEYAPLEIILWRAIGGIPPAIWLAGGRMRIRGVRWLALRCLFGFSAMWSWVTATKGLGIGELSVLGRLQPFFVSIVAPLLLDRSERPEGTVWLAMGVGFAGSTILIWPDLVGLNLDVMGFAGLAVLAAVFSAFAHTSLRALGPTDHPATVVVWFQIVVLLLACALLGLTQTPVQLPAWSHVPVLLGIGVLAAAGQTALTSAYQADQAPRVATASYAGPVFGFAIDVAIFSLPPSWFDLVGTAIVLAAGLLLVRRSQAR